MPLPQFNIGSGKPWSEQDAVKALLDRFGDLAQRLGQISSSVESLRTSFARLAELSGRLSASLMLLVGAPRVMRSGLTYGLLGGRSSSGSKSGGDSSSGDFSWGNVEGDRADWIETKLRQDEEYFRRRQALSKQFFKESKTLEQRLEEYKIEAVARAEIRAKMFAHGKAHAKGENPPHPYPDLVGSGASTPVSAMPVDALANLTGASPSYPAMRMDSPANLTGAVPSSSPRRSLIERVMAGAGSVVGGLAGTAYGSISGRGSKSASDASAYGRALGSAAGAALGRTLSQGIGRVAGLGSGIKSMLTGTVDQKDQAKVLERWGKGLSEAGQKVTYAFLGVAAASQGLLHAASPDVFATFTGSLQLLAAVVGRTLTPLFLKLSFGVQKLAFWFESEGKKWLKPLGGIAEMALTLTGLGLAARGVVTAFGFLTSKLGLVTIGLVGLVGGIEAYKKVIKKEEAFEKARVKAITDQVTLEEAAKDPAIGDLLENKNVKAGRIGPKEFGPILIDQMDFEHKTLAKLKRAWEISKGAKVMQAFDEYFSDGLFSGATYAGMREMGKKIKTPEERDEFFSQEILRSERRVTVLSQFLTSMTGGKPLPSEKDLPSETKTDAAQQLLMNISSLRVQPRFQSVEEAYKNVQIEALGSSPLENMLQKIVTDHLIEINDNLMKILGVKDELGLLHNTQKY